MFNQQMKKLSKTTCHIKVDRSQLKGAAATGQRQDNSRIKKKKDCNRWKQFKYIQAYKFMMIFLKRQKPHGYLWRLSGHQLITAV